MIEVRFGVVCRILDALVASDSDYAHSANLILRLYLS